MGTGKSAQLGLSQTSACFHTGAAKLRTTVFPSTIFLHSLLRCVPRPCYSSSACTRRNSYESMWRSLPSTTYSSWSTPTRHLCSLEPTRTQVWCRFFRGVLSTRCVSGSGLGLGDRAGSKLSPAQPAREDSQTVITRTSRPQVAKLGVCGSPEGAPDPA